MPELRHVFISHSSRDNEVSRRVTDILEAAGIRCWYSSRPSDLEPGVEWDDNIVSALDKSIAVVLLFSAASNASKWVKRELAMASARGLTVYPVRIEDVKPTGGMEAYLISVQWIDVFDGTWEVRLAPIIRKLGGSVGLEERPLAVRSSRVEQRTAEPQKRTGPPFLMSPGGNRLWPDPWEPPRWLARFYYDSITRLVTAVMFMTLLAAALNVLGLMSLVSIIVSITLCVPVYIYVEIRIRRHQNRLITYIRPE